MQDQYSQSKTRSRDLSEHKQVTLSLQQQWLDEAEQRKESININQNDTKETQESIQVLQDILNNLSSIDQEMYFQIEVDEANAPKYYQIVEKPMYFQKMREKLQLQEYQTWQQFIEDFKLIYQNALLYNLKRTKHYKAAQSLQKNGKRILKEQEFAGRKAFQQMFPDHNVAVVDTIGIQNEALDLEDLIDIEPEKLEDFPILQRVKQNIQQAALESKQQLQDQESFDFQNRTEAKSIDFSGNIFDIPQYNQDKYYDSLFDKEATRNKRDFKEFFLQGQPKVKVEDIHSITLELDSTLDQQSIEQVLQRLEKYRLYQRSQIQEPLKPQDIIQSDYKQNLDWRFGWLFHRICELEQQEHNLLQQLKSLEQQEQQLQQQTSLGYNTRKSPYELVDINIKQNEFNQFQENYNLRQKRKRNVDLQPISICHHPFYLQHTALKADHSLGAHNFDEIQKYNKQLIYAFKQDTPIQQVKMDSYQKDIPARIYRAVDILNEQLHNMLDKILENVQIEDFKQTYMPLSNTQQKASKQVQSNFNRSQILYQRQINKQKSQTLKQKKVQGPLKQNSNLDSDQIHQMWQSRKSIDFDENHNQVMSLQQMSSFKPPKRLSTEEIFIPSVRELSTEEQSLPQKIRESLSKIDDIEGFIYFSRKCKKNNEINNFPEYPEQIIKLNIKDKFKNNELYRQLYEEEGSSEEQSEDEDCLERHILLEQQEISHINTVADTLVNRRKSQPPQAIPNNKGSNDATGVSNEK